MLIFTNKNKNKNYIFIHIPKNGGTYIRCKIENDVNNKIIKSYWKISSNLDLAHIPYIKKDDFIEKDLIYNIFTYTRCPYDRIISAYFYKNKNKDIDNFKNFIKNQLALLNFSLNFDFNIIHYYPQYLFICDQNFKICDDIKIYKLEDVEQPVKYDLNIYLDEKCIEIINKVYEKDFSTFEYKMINNV